MNNKIINFQSHLAACLLVSLTLLVSCDKSTKQTTSDTTVGKVAESKMKTSQAPKSCDEMGVSHKIDADSAASYIWAFLSNDTCSPVAERFGLGGYFPIEIPSPNKEGYEGTLFFPCIHNRSLRPDQVYFAKQNAKVCPGKTDLSTLIIPGRKLASSNVFFDYPNEEINSKIDLLNYLYDFKIKNVNQINRDSTASKTILIDNFEYKEIFAQYPGFAEYGFGFIRREFMDSLYTENVLPNGTHPAGFITFLGFAKGNDAEKVRMILMPVMEDGRILNSSNTYCLEKSWPPINPSLMLY